jgi:hypothetical protein
VRWMRTNKWNLSHELLQDRRMRARRRRMRHTAYRLRLQRILRWRLLDVATPQQDGAVSEGG